MCRNQRTSGLAGWAGQFRGSERRSEASVPTAGRPGLTGRPTSLQATALPWQPTCRFCNALIDRHEAVRSGVCSARSRQTRRIQEAAALVRERRWQAHVARWQTHITSLCQIIETHGSEIDAAAAELGGDPAEIAYGLVPRQDRPLSSLPDERRVDFGTRVNQVVTAAFAEEAPKSPTDRGGEEPRAPPDVRCLRHFRGPMLHPWGGQPCLPDGRHDPTVLSRASRNDGGRRNRSLSGPPARAFGRGQLRLSR